METLLQLPPPPPPAKKITNHGHGSRSLRISLAAIPAVISCQSILIMLTISRKSFRICSESTYVRYPLNCALYLRRIASNSSIKCAMAGRTSWASVSSCTRRFSVKWPPTTPYDVLGWRCRAALHCAAAVQTPTAATAGFTPLHLAAENFSVDMVKLLFRHGASANIRTKGEDVVEGLLPLHVAVENASMHKYLEDNWTNGDHIVSLIFLLCLPEMKILLDTTRLIAKQTDSIVDEVWNYIRAEKLVKAAILLLAAQKQLRGCLNKSSNQVSLNGFDIVKSNIDEALDTLHLEVLTTVQEGKKGKALKQLKDKKEALLTARVLVGTVHKTREAAALLTEREVSLNGFDIVKSHIDEALDSLHRKGLAMVKEGRNGKALQMLQNKKEALLTAHALVGIIQKAGEVLEGCIQTYTEVSHEEIVEHVSSILTSGIVYSGKGIDTGNLECYQYGAMPIDRSRSESGDCEKTNEADKSSSLEDEVSKRILMRRKDWP
ncbi:hypothetical protein C2845_PM07G36360 [Panicum miliaceum]|uniref:Uncharacterized protein n=1 Tax=Panicum miliaceum TaxID=4540 RepID=A0A3L6SSF4_PANMI|nr:hypothetical protein C2845_PM07G36360 [Panicum miliaceum]